MAQNIIQDGDIIDFVNGTGATVTSGSGVLIGVRLGVALLDIANGATGACAVSKVAELPKLSTDVVAQGAALYWDNTNKRLTTTASGNTLAGYAFKAAGNGVSTVNIKLNA
jgi:predicted RecA/RadA family phage recombinase